MLNCEAGRKAGKDFLDGQQLAQVRRRVLMRRSSLPGRGCFIMSNRASRQRLLCGFALAALSLFSSCLKTENPVTDAQQGGRDKGLCGAWKYQDRDGTLWLLQFGYLD